MIGETRSHASSFETTLHVCPVRRSGASSRTDHAAMSCSTSVYGRPVSAVITSRSPSESCLHAPANSNGTRRPPSGACAHEGLLKAGLIAIVLRSDSRLRRPCAAYLSAVSRSNPADLISASAAFNWSSGPTFTSTPRSRTTRAAGTTTRCPLPSAVDMSGSSKVGISTRAVSDSTNRSHAPAPETTTERAARLSTSSSPSSARTALMTARASSLEGASTVMTWDDRASASLNAEAVSRPASRKDLGRTGWVWLDQVAHHLSGVLTSRGSRPSSSEIQI